jgi:hypothetical protein
LWPCQSWLGGGRQDPLLYDFEFFACRIAQSFCSRSYSVQLVLKLAFGPNNALHLISLYCEKRRYPLPNSIVVNQETGFSGDEHPRKMKPEDFLIERARAFAFRSSKDKPSSDDFAGVAKVVHPGRMEREQLSKKRPGV